MKEKTPDLAGTGSLLAGDIDKAGLDVKLGYAAVNRVRGGEDVRVRDRGIRSARRVRGRRHDTGGYISVPHTIGKK